MFPLENKEKALRLRSRGYSVKEIADKLQIAKSTSSFWVRNIRLNKKAQQRLTKKRLISYYKTSLRWQKKRAKEERQYKSIALKTLNRIKKDSNHAKIYCTLLYWCEGEKRSSEVRFINSDPVLIKTFLFLFRKSFTVDEKKFRALIHLHEYHNEKRQREFWSKTTGISQNLFQRSYHKPHTKKRIREGYQGCISVKYYDAKVAKEMRALYKVFSEKWGRRLTGKPLLSKRRIL